jgi:hypothetical protein
MQSLEGLSKDPPIPSAPHVSCVPCPVRLEWPPLSLQVPLDPMASATMLRLNAGDYDAPRRP